MNKLLLSLALVITVIFSAWAQFDDLYTFEKGTSLAGVNVGVKLANDKRTALSAFYEHGLLKLFVDECTFGGGVFGGYYSDKLREEILKVYIAGLRANIHYQFIDGLDTYAGIAPNFNIQTNNIAKDKAEFACYFHIGGRYYLNNWLGLFAEMSTGFNNFSGGLSVKF
jgi:energy-converting hydrogenase Eha subunit H